MDISFDLYYIFYKVCKLGSMSKAAEELCVTQPSITKHINNLEMQLEKTLFERNSKGIKLTSDGERLFNEIKDSIEVLNKVEEKIKGNSESSEIIIKIIAGQSTIKNLLLNAISEFNKKYPNVIFELSTFKYDTAIQKLREGTVDLIFFSMKEVSTLYSNIDVKEFIELHDIFVVSDTMKNKFPGELDLLNLNYYPFFCKKGNDITRQAIEELFYKNGMEFKPKYELSNNWIIEEYAKRGMGIGIVAEEFVKEDLDSGKLIKLKTKQKLPSRKMGYAIRTNSGNYTIVKSFIKEILKSLQ